MQAWTQDNATNLRDFLRVCPHFIDHLKSRKPKLDKKTLESTALSAAGIEGFEDCIKEIASFSNEIKVDPTAPNFVDLEKD